MSQRRSKRALTVLALLVLAGVAALAIAVAGGSSGWLKPWALFSGPTDAQLHTMIWQIRLPRALGAALVGGLLGLSGAIAQGVFRNPLADPFLLGSASGAALAVAFTLAWGARAGASMDWIARLGLTGAAFLGAVLGVVLTLLLSRGTAHTPRLLLGGIVVGVVLSAITQLLGSWNPEILSSMQAFNLGSTAFLGWDAAALMLVVLLLCVGFAAASARVLDALSLGEDTARSLGLGVGPQRLALVLAMALCTGCAVAQAGLIAFVGLAAPHIVRGLGLTQHRDLLVSGTLAGAVLLLAADALARTLIAPAELPVGVLTAIVGGMYLFWALQRDYQT